VKRIPGWLGAAASIVVVGCGASGSEERRDGGDDAVSDPTTGDVATVADGTLATTDATTATSDDGPAAGEVLADVGAPTGAACDAGADCASGWCAPSAIGTVCVEVCVTECPDDHVCVQADNGGADLVFLCVPLDRPSSGGDTTGGDASAPDAQVGDDAPDVAPDVGIDHDVVGPDAPDGSVSDGDQDGDGIPDDEDHIPCLGFFLTVYNEGVTAASLTLNGVEVVSASSFPTSDPVIVPLNPVQGDNTLALSGKLTGSPSDALTLVVQDTTGRLWFYVVIVRQPGAPTSNSHTLVIDVDCDAPAP